VYECRGYNGELSAADAIALREREGGSGGSPLGQSGWGGKMGSGKEGIRHPTTFGGGKIAVRPWRR